MTNQNKCSVAGCNRPYSAKGFCYGHYQRTRLSPGVPMDAPFCKSENHKGTKNGRWTGGEIEDGHGRFLIYSPNHPNPSYNKTHVYRYRLVMEKHLGRLLTRKEIVHHKNGIPNDDRIENLEIMTQSEHAKLHIKLRNKKGQFNSCK